MFQRAKFFAAGPSRDALIRIYATDKCKLSLFPRSIPRVSGNRGRIWRSKSASENRFNLRAMSRNIACSL